MVGSETAPRSRSSARWTSEQIGRALAALHDRPAHPWTLEELPGQVGMSRAVAAGKRDATTASG
jgi:hypothetical protein